MYVERKFVINGEVKVKLNGNNILYGWRLYFLYSFFIF